MHCYFSFILFLLIVNVSCLALDVITPDDRPGSYGPSEEVSYDDNVWPKSISQPIQDFLIRYFNNYIDDASGIDAAANDKNCNAFTNLFISDATYNFNGQASTGTAAIQATCLAIFQTIPYRKHSTTKAYSFGRDDNEVVLTGSVKYGMKSVDEKSREWTEIFHLVDVDGGIKIQSERIWADPES